MPYTESKRAPGAGVLFKTLLLIQYVINEWNECLAAGYIGSGIIVVLNSQMEIIALESPMTGKSAISLMNHWSNSDAFKINL